MATRRRPTISVRTQIVAAITLVAAIGLTAVGLSVYVVERQRILEGIDDRLHANLDSARYLIVGGDPEVGAWESSTQALRAVVRRMSPDDNTGAMGMADGVITTLPGMALDVDLQHEDAFAQHVQKQLRTDEPIMGTYVDSANTWRYLAAPIHVEGSADPAVVTFVMVYDVDAELAEINTAGRAFLIASTIALIVIAATGTIVATRLLRPLRHMRQTAERVSAQSLTERLPVVGHDDVADLAQTMNDMLDRLDSALDSQRQLLSDVGHELKTPLTVVRGHLEVMDPTSVEDATDTQLLAIDELDRMDRLVQDLAAAASLHGPAPVQMLPVDAADLVDQITRKAEGIVGAEVTRGPRAHVVASLDAARITQALLQLAQNAVTHGGGQLEIGSKADADMIHMWVRDNGPGVPDEQKPHVFERFHRGSHATQHTGSGLGLNIVDVIARAHGGSVSVEDAEGGGARFIVRVPLHPTRPHESTGAHRTYAPEPLPAGED